CEIRGQQGEGDHGASDDVADHDLQKDQTPKIGHRRRGNDGEHAGFGGNDAQGNSPPRDVTLRVEIRLRVGGFTAYPYAESHAKTQIQQEYKKVDSCHEAAPCPMSATAPSTSSARVNTFASWEISRSSWTRS